MLSGQLSVLDPPPSGLERDGPEAKATLWAGGRELLVSISGERRKFSVFPERRKQIAKPSAAMLLK